MNPGKNVHFTLVGWSFTRWQNLQGVHETFRDTGPSSGLAMQQWLEISLMTHSSDVHTISEKKNRPTVLLFYNGREHSMWESGGKSKRLRWGRIMRWRLLFKDWSHDNRRPRLLSEICWAFFKREEEKAEGVYAAIMCSLQGYGLWPNRGIFCLL